MVAMNNNKMAENSWWAFSPEHGWVVLDRTLPHNKCTDMPEFLEFTRCSDWSNYEQADLPWTYREAGRYLESLNAREALERARELNELKQEFTIRLQRAA